MADRFQKLRALGEFGGWVATILTILTANPVVVGAAVVSIIASLWGWSFGLLTNQHVQIAVGTFFVLFWLYVGFCLLADRGRPRLTQPFLDYRHGLTFEGMPPAYYGTNERLESLRGVLQFSVQLRNFSPGPIRYVLEDADIRIGTRSIPKQKGALATAYMARGAGRTVRVPGFPAGTLAEFFGMGETKGTADFAIAYGAVDGPPTRRLKISIEFTAIFPQSGAIDVATGQLLAYSDNLLSEVDEPI